MKTLALALASTLAAVPASAGVYVNVESNASYTGSDYESRTTDFHVGYEGGNETFDYYVQGGPAVVAVDGTDDSDTQLSGKVGATVAATEKLDFYGEVSVITAEGDVDNSWGTKIGTKYKF
jgi:outer membrane autotransporter protein